MIYLLNNIKFGHPKLLKHQLDYFNRDLITGLHLEFSPEDKIIITGDLFYNTKYITFDLLSKVKETLQEIPIPVEIIGNDYCYKLFNFKKIENINFEIDDVSLFQIDKNDKSRIGFCIHDGNDVRFIKNDITPKFLEYTINIIEDLNEVQLTKDFIDLTINSSLLENQQNKNIIDLFLNNNTFNNIYYTEKIKVDEKVEMDSQNINIRNILINNVDENLKEELSEIFLIYDEKKQ
jgi:hypothetical protein